MSTIEQIETAILTLAPDEFQRLRQWFCDVDYQRWDSIDRLVIRSIDDLFQ